MHEITLFSGKIYTVGKNFTRPPVVTVATNLNSGYSANGPWRAEMSNDKASDGRPHATWSTMINNSNSTHPWKCPHHSLGFHPLAVDHEKQKHEEHHEVEDQNEHRQPGRSEKKRVERGPKTRRRRRSLRKWLSRGPCQGHMRCRWANLNQTVSCVHTHS